MCVSLLSTLYAAFVILRLLEQLADFVEFNKFNALVEFVCFRLDVASSGETRYLGNGNTQSIGCLRHCYPFFVWHRSVSLSHEV